MRRHIRRSFLHVPTLALLTLPLFACAADEPLDDENSRFPGKGDGSVEPGSAEARAVLMLVNDPKVDFDELDVDARLNARAARNIIEHRNGADGVAGTADDDGFANLGELDDVSFVGPFALRALLGYATDQGLLVRERGLEVIFSPQPQESSHTAQIAKMIDEAQDTIDIAMYSFSNADVSDALERAVDRGVDVRFIFQTAHDDRTLDGDALASSKSGRLEQAGVDVRWVNKIMHHKFVIIDGPRDELRRAATARIASGSANWSFGGATIFDENTAFLTGTPELALRLQREFDLMWDHSKDLSLGDLADAVPAGLAITEDMVASQDEAGLDLTVTSDNFTVSPGSTTFRVDKSQMHGADAWVAAIEGAESSIWIASGHLRLRPVAEALIAKKQANPDIDIRVYLDGQEYISEGGDFFQRQEVEDCLADATTDTQVFDCENKSFLFSKMVSDAGVDLRFKYYAYRWDFSYAVQMHHKYMIVDGKELLTGSFNLSINAEHSTFENIMHFAGSAYQPLIDAYIDNYERIWDTGKDGLLEGLSGEIANDATFPIVFDPMALTWKQVTDLKQLIRDNCPDVDSDEFRSNPASHKFCSR